MTSVRPGAALLVSLVGEERRGRPGPAREAALAAAASDPAGRSFHLFDAVYASLVAGEPKRALQLLDRVDALSHPDVAARTAACRAWASQLDTNWYPGGAGALLAGNWTSKVTFVDRPTSINPETRLVEAIVSLGPVPLLTNRANLQMATATFMGSLQQFLSFSVAQLDEFALVASATQTWSSELWARLAQADLAWRAGFHDVANSTVLNMRQAAGNAGDAVGVASTYVVEGDWWSTPGASPETRGFRLIRGPVTTAPDANPERARAAYSAAAAALASADAPRATGAVALRFAHLDVELGDIAAAEAHLATAAAAFDEAGDAAALHLVAVHRIIADLAADRTAATRRAAGSGWSLMARGPIGEVVAWSQAVGSASFCTGLGHLLERAGDRWRSEGQFERAAVAYSCAVPLVGASGAVPPGRVLAAIGVVDGVRNLNVRAAVRFAQAGDHMPEPPSPDVDPLSWLEHLELLTSIAGAQSATLTSSPTAFSIRGVEQLVGHMRALARLAGPDAPPIHPALGDAQAATLAIAQQLASKDFEDLAADTKLSAAQQAAPFLAQAIPALGSQIGMYTFLLAMSRARLAARGGWEHESKRWFQEALRLVDDGTAPEYMAVSALIASGMEDAARARFERIRASGFLPDDTLAVLAVRARAYDVADELIGRIGGNPDNLDWLSLSDRAEVALELGDPERAAAFADAAVARLESIVGRLARDPDRVAATDDVKVAALYLIACRAHGELAAADPSHGERCLALADRARSLAIMGLVDHSAATSSGGLRRRWQEAATNWAAAFERLRVCYDNDDATGRVVRSAELTAADDLLTDVEAEIESIDAGILSAPLLSPPLDGAALRAALPEDACLIEYLLVGRELVIVTATSTEVGAVHRRLDYPGVEPLVHQLWRACADGSPGSEAADLATILLDPVRECVAAHRRVVIIPFGPLNAVPFHALPFDGGLLADEHVVSYLPTAALLLEGTPFDAPIADGRSLVVGDPAFDSSAYPDLERLEGSAVEARYVAARLGTRALIADEAREDDLRAQMADLSILHFAAHGHLDDVAPSTSSLVLAGRDELTVADLIGLRLDADLAVLSACDSGRGTATLGGDLVGLTRGLIAAGVRRCVVSLWPVDDVAACVTMAAFYDRLTTGQSPALALWEAQRALRSMSADDIADRYRDMGGAASAGDRSRRRGSLTTTAADGVARVIALDADFIDDVDDEPVVDAPAPSGGHHRIWAPFILIGV